MILNFRNFMIIIGILLFLIVILYEVSDIVSSYSKCKINEEFDNSTNSCRYDVKPDGSLVMVPSDCSKGEIFMDGYCYRKLKPIIEKQYLTYGTIVILMMLFFIVGLYLGTQFTSKERKLDIVYEEEGINAMKSWWAKHFKMPMFENKTNPDNFIILDEYRPFFDVNGRPWIILNVDISGCQNPDGNGVFTWKIPLFMGIEKILSGGSTFERITLDSHKSRREYPFASVRDEMLRYLETIEEPEVRARFQEALIKEKLLPETRESIAGKSSLEVKSMKQKNSRKI